MSNRSDKPTAPPTSQEDLEADELSRYLEHIEKPERERGRSGLLRSLAIGEAVCKRKRRQ